MKPINFIRTILLLLSPMAIFSQNVGIGTTNPSVKLEVLSEDAHTAKMTGPNGMYISLFENNNYRGYLGSFAGSAEDVDFGTGGSNTTGRLHLTIMAQPRLTIASNGNVGIGTITPSARLDVNGITNLRQALQINGNAGTAGQVLTSNGNGAPVWQNSALSNTIRFGARYQRVGSGGTLSLQTTFYNQSPGDISLGSANITINKSGLYRFNGYTSGLVQGAFTQSPEMTFDMNFAGAFSTQYDLLQWRPMSKRTAVNNNYYDVIPYELDIYLPAGTIISLGSGYLADATISYQEANIRVFGYIISE